jgi:hypothetical protein
MAARINFRTAYYSHLGVPNTSLKTALEHLFSQELMGSPRSFSLIPQSKNISRRFPLAEAYTAVRFTSSLPTTCMEVASGYERLRCWCAFLTIRCAGVLPPYREAWESVQAQKNSYYTDLERLSGVLEGPGGRAEEDPSAVLSRLLLLHSSMADPMSSCLSQVSSVPLFDEGWYRAVSSVFRGALEPADAFHCARRFLSLSPPHAHTAQLYQVREIEEREDEERGMEQQDLCFECI